LHPTGDWSVPQQGLALRPGSLRNRGILPRNCKRMLQDVPADILVELNFPDQDLLNDGPRG
jgi:hypothetical protein